MGGASAHASRALDAATFAVGPSGRGGDANASAAPCQAGDDCHTGAARRSLFTTDEPTPQEAVLDPTLAALRIQTLARGRLARWPVTCRLPRPAFASGRVHRAATHIQACWRRCDAMDWLYTHRLDRDAAIRLQAAVRGGLARKAVPLAHRPYTRRVRQKFLVAGRMSRGVGWVSMKDYLAASAILLQAAARGWRARGYILGETYLNNVYIQESAAAAAREERLQRLVDYSIPGWFWAEPAAAQVRGGPGRQRPRQHKQKKDSSSNSVWADGNNLLSPATGQAAVRGRCGASSQAATPTPASACLGTPGFDGTSLPRFVLPDCDPDVHLPWEFRWGEYYDALPGYDAWLRGAELLAHDDEFFEESLDAARAPRASMARATPGPTSTR
mmetsp:Transcript_2906/g.7445  ORF Transcript_2906/g.7445 Transcript_2906/m.7445 type:complete len:387 (-) Transcript_2906:139-1299(-)